MTKNKNLSIKTNTNIKSPRRARVVHKNRFSAIFLVSASLISLAFVIGFYQYFTERIDNIAIFPVGIITIILIWFIALYSYF